MASLEDLNAKRDHSIEFYLASPGLSFFDLQLHIVQQEPLWDEYSGSAESGLDFGIAGSASDEPYSVARRPTSEAPIQPPEAIALALTLPLESEQERRERTHREHLRWSLIAGAPHGRYCRIDGAQLLRDIIVINKPLYDASVAFDQRPQSVEINVWITVAVGAGRDLIARTAHALREFQERDFRTQFGAVEMRYILLLYNEEFLIRDLAQMRLTGNTRILKPRYDRIWLAATATFGVAFKIKPTFSAAQIRAIMQSLGLSQVDAMEVNSGAAASA